MGIFDKLRDAEPRTEPAPRQERCPWCGEEMRLGWLEAQKGDIWWVTKKPGTGSGVLVGADPNTSLLVSDEGVLFTHKTAWWCPECQKMVLDTTGIRRPLGCAMEQEEKV